LAVWPPPDGPPAFAAASSAPRVAARLFPRRPVPPPSAWALLPLSAPFRLRARARCCPLSRSARGVCCPGLPPSCSSGPAAPVFPCGGPAIPRLPAPSLGFCGCCVVPMAFLPALRLPSPPACSRPAPPPASPRPSPAPPLALGCARPRAPRAFFPLSASPFCMPFPSPRPGSAWLLPGPLASGPGGCSLAASPPPWAPGFCPAFVAVPPCSPRACSPSSRRPPLALGPARCSALPSPPRVASPSCGGPAPGFPFPSRLSVSFRCRLFRGRPAWRLRPPPRLLPRPRGPLSPSGARPPRYRPLSARFPVVSACSVCAGAARACAAGRRRPLSRRAARALPAAPPLGGARCRPVSSAPLSLLPPPWCLRP